MAEEKKPEKTEKSKLNEQILEHSYNPKFEILKPEEVKALLERFNAKIIQLPKININDPICKLMSAKVNDVFKITRKSYTSEDSVFYRVVVDG
ncbi:MAG: DNA-directed RNA polymerase subunit H [Nanoarchaeota archaeon]|nr:DNA-directed RNA polymerase subunit H [Nanoarchaeota archaeon]